MQRSFSQVLEEMKQPTKYDLVDITDMAHLVGIRFDTSMSRAAWKDVVDVNYHNSKDRSIANCLWDVVLLLYLAIENSKTKTTEVSYQIAIMKNGLSTDVGLKAKFLPKENGEVSILIMLIEEVENGNG